MSTPQGGVPDEPLKPVILDGHAETFTPAPTVPGQMIMRPASPKHAAIRGAVAALLVAGGVLNLVFGSMFPSNAPVESILNFFLAVDMFLGAVALGVFAVLANIRRSVPVLPERTSPLSIVALGLSAVAFIGWVLFGLTIIITNLSRGQGLSYSTNVGSLWILGVPWILGIVFATISLRSGGRRTAVYAGIALALGILMMVVVVGSAILYGLGLTS